MNILSSNSALKAAEAAIGNGDYSQGIFLLESIVSQKKLTPQENAKAQILLATAWVGKGNDQQAISTCKKLLKDKNDIIRHQAKQLIEILEAPSLPRPSSWSVEIPKINLMPTTSETINYKSSKKRNENEEILPPTGPTKNLTTGFSIVVLIILILLTILLSGCVEITSTIETPAPNRVKMSWDIESNSHIHMQWQKDFATSLKKDLPKATILKEPNGFQKIEFPVETSIEANKILNKIVETASITSGFKIMPPILELKERNLIFSVKQNLRLYFDLTNLPNIPGLKLTIVFQPKLSEKNFSSNPLKVTFNENNQAIWILKTGEKNELNIINWKWSRIGIGTLLVLLITGISLSLQKIRVQMGFGYPELPP